MQDFFWHNNRLWASVEPLNGTALIITENGTWQIAQPFAGYEVKHLLSELTSQDRAALTASVSKVNNIARTAVVSGTATKGADVSIGSQSVKASTTDGTWSITATGLKVGANDLKAIQKINNVELDNKTVSATIVEGGTVVGVDQGPIDLARGESKQVPMVVQNNEARSNWDGTVTLTAPEGTTFDGQTRIDTSWRPVGGTTWSPVTSMPLTNGRLSNNDKTITFDAKWTENHGAPEQYRYMLNVTANDDAAAGSGQMGFVFAGDSSKGDFRATGKTTTNLGVAQRDLAAEVESVDHAAGTALIGGTATPGATITIGDESTEVAEDGSWSLEVGGLENGENPLVVEQKIGDEVIDTKPIVVTINDAAIIGQDGPAVTLERGERTKVQAQFETKGQVSRPDAQVTFTAPEGTTFAEGQNTLEGAYKLPGEDWANRSATLTDGDLSMDGKTYTYTFKPSGSTWTLPDASLLRWSIDVETPADAEQGASSMRTNLVGTAVEGSFNTTSTTATTVERSEAPSPADLVVTTPANGSTVDTKRPVFSGTGDEGATIEIKGSTGRVVATTTVKDGTWSVPAGFDLVDGSYALTATQTPLVGEKSTAPINFVVAAMVPVTLTAPAIGANVDTAKPVFSGRGTVGATVQVKGTFGTVLATAIVQRDGTWEATSDVTLADGNYVGKAWQTVNGKTTTADFRFTVAQSTTPVTLTAPAIGANVDTAKPVFSGRGTVGATVQVKGTFGTVLATAIVQRDGTWEATSDVTLADGNYVGKAWQTVNGKTTTADFRFTVAQSTTPVTLETPAIGAEIEDTKPVFTGKGQPGATVQVKGTYGTLLATAEVDDNGDWEATSDVALARGGYAGKAWQTVNGKTTTADFRFTIVAPMVPVSLTAPAQGAQISTPKPVFTGKGTADADITITGASGTRLASGKVRSDGGFDLTSTIALGAGSYSGTVRQDAGGRITTAPFQFRIVFTAVTLESPAIGAALTDGTPVFSGKGTPKAPLTIKGSGGTTLATGTVNDDGTWSLRSTVTLPTGRYTGTVLQTLPGSDTTAPFSFSVS
ncbi:hypothetical protein I8920_02190 [Curtobacterium sp. YC1]|uniref:Ig-like domain-containing protein n=1 Tax=Curtobacterium sp. YC1 TaxID=2795488 RepID=UPI0018E50B35|nr:Ig-like domain-containing protein [Curtobacterium sp. YC1]QQD76602.1 hypothetical protein I8920_02190 [Curtobacterium sp. YC1]